MIGVMTDITDFKRHEESLRQSRAALEEAQRIGRIGSWKLDLATKQVVWSAELYRMLGLSPDVPPPDFDGQRRLFTPESYDSMVSAVATTARDGTPYTIELEVIRADQ